MLKTDPLYLIDGSAYIYRAYHAVAPLTNSSGLPTHAVFGFTNILLRVMRDKKPKFLAVAFDMRGPTFRHGMYGEYKANRPPMPEDLAVQIPYIKEVVASYNIMALEKSGYEADDLIAAAVRMAVGRGRPVVIISGDKDLLQLVSDSVTMWDPMNDRLMDPEFILKKYNVGPDRLTDLFSLIGDASDNVPGVPGIGPRTAEKLINQFGSLDALLKDTDRIEKPKLREKIIESRDLALLSRNLIRLADDVDIPASMDDYLVTGPDEDRLRDLFGRLEFAKLLKTETSALHLDKEGYCLVRTEEELASLVDILNRAELIVVDTETTSLDPLTAGLVGISFCVDAQMAYYIPVGHRDAGGKAAPGQPDRDRTLALLRPVLENPAIAKLGHNLKFDWSVLLTQGVTLAGDLHDSMIASYLLDPSRRTHKLDDLAEAHLSRRLTSFEEVTERAGSPGNFAGVALDDARDYSCEDVRASLLLWNEFRPRIEELGLWDLYKATEMRLVPILALMERHGILVDEGKLDALVDEFTGMLATLEARIFVLAGEEFNIGSPKQLGEILFEKLNLPHGRKTKTGYSTDVKVLQQLGNYHELPATVITHRNIAKLKSTYVDKLKTLIHPATGRVHTSFNQTVTATGRLSSSNPNLQNIPIRTEEGRRIRAAFVAAPGQVFVAADYSQIDLRVFAHYSGDKTLLEAFRSGEDIHKRTAAEIFRVHPGLVNSEMRRVAKTINFGIVYGMSAFGLADQLNLSRKEAKTFIDRYFDHYRGVKQFMEDIVVQARRDGYVTTLLNRRRLLPDINSTNKNQREFAERTAINTPIQGTAADIIKLAMIKTDEALGAAGMEAKMLLQIHDELVFEVPSQDADRAGELIKQAMESVMTLDVPLIVNLSKGASLAET